jgi:MoxR-like ATPase
MTGAADDMETTVAPSAIEQAMSVFEKLRERDHAEIVQARKAVTEYIFGQVAAGQTDKQRLIVAGLAHLKSLERMARKRIRSRSRRRIRDEDTSQ